MRCSALELVDRVHAKPGALGYALLRKPEPQAVGSKRGRE
jgi:hypothetical protein